MRFHSVSITLVAAAGVLVAGCSEQSPSAAPPDTEPPSITLTAPGSGTVSGTVTVSATAVDDHAVRGVQFLIDDDPLGAEDREAPYAFQWNTTLGPNVPHRISEVAQDFEGNPGASNSVTVTVDNSTTGSAQVQVTTDGADLDPDGYAVTVAGAALALPVNGAVLASGIPLGQPTFQLGGLAGNCTAIGYAFAQPGVIVGVTASVQFHVHCESLSSPTGQIVWRHQPAPGADYALFAINRDGTGKQLLRQSDDLDPEWTGDHSAFLFTSYEALVPGIFARGEAGNERQLIAGTGYSDATWAPDGVSVAYVYDRQGIDMIFGNTRASFGIVLAEGTRPAWAPGNDSILYVRGGDIWLVSSTATNPHRVVTGGSSPRWSPNGSKILFWRDQGSGVGSYWIANADGTGATMAIQGSFLADEGASWSPNGRQFVYSSRAGGQSNLWIVNTDGTGAVNITNGTGESNTQPTWFR